MPDILQPSFWDDDAQGLWDDLGEEILTIYMQGLDGGVAALPSRVRVLADFDLVNQAAMSFAARYRYDTIAGIVDTTRKQTQQIFSDWIQSGSPLDVLETALEPVFGDARAERIAVTETTRVFARANMDAWESTGMVESATWMTAQDDLVCPICGELDGSDVGLGDIDAAPPAHANCRCYLQPQVSDKLIEQALENA